MATIQNVNSPPWLIRILSLDAIKEILYLDIWEPKDYIVNISFGIEWLLIILLAIVFLFYIRFHFTIYNHKFVVMLRKYIVNKKKN